MKELIKYCDYEKMEEINDILNHEGIDEEKIDINTIKKYPQIRDYISLFEYNALKNDFVNDIVFKLEE